MKQKFENIKHNKGEPRRKNKSLSADHLVEPDVFSSNIIEKGFVAWPGKSISHKHKNRVQKVPEGCTQNGGYVAFPKPENVSE